LARKVGADGKRMRAALDSRRHRKLVERDIAAAKNAEIVEVPAVLVNGYLLSGVAPLEAYAQAVARALAEMGNPEGGSAPAKAAGFARGQP
jgi:predicted DsbA family dithiol-disulfide isomerase